jgi:ferritin-like metal-binding protein YciE
VLLAWLNDAYAMERRQVEVLIRHAREAERLVALQQKLHEHIEITRRHADTLSDCITQLSGTEPPAMSPEQQAPGEILPSRPGEELLRNAMSDYATESLEIIRYKALMEAAAVSGHVELVPVFEEIMGDEEDMAAWLEQNLTMVIRDSIDTAA